MPKQVNLRYLPVAVDDLVSIFDWIAGDSPVKAAAFIEKNHHGIGNLQNYPLVGRVPRDDKLKNLGYRVLVIESYLVFCVLRGSTVEIHRIIRGSRNLDRII
jgi:plasmid stabilization system protein ParE